MKRAKKTLALWLAAACMVLAAGTLYVHQVDNSLTGEDRRYIARFLDGIAPLPERPAYAKQLEFILAVQRSVLAAASGNEGIPHGRAREPKDLYLSRSGLCYDRSRSIEKILAYSGFETRHVAVYAVKGSRSALGVLVSKDADSHSVTEVRTRKGWLVVDSNVAWVSVDRECNPLSIEALREAAQRSRPLPWAMEPAPRIFREPFTFVYGLYSRHGRFYPPYDFLPDIHYGELLRNFVGSPEDLW